MLPPRNRPKPTPTRRPRAGVPLTLEILEDRTLLSGVAPAPDPGAQAGAAPYDPSRVLVRFLDGAAPAPALAGTAVGPAVDAASDLYEVDLSGGVSVAEAVAAYQADPEVVSAEPDYRVTAAWTPNDTLFPSQANMQTIQAPAAWGVTTGTQRTVVAVIDTGIDHTQPDLYRNIWLNQAEIPRSRLKNLIDVDGDGRITFKDLNDPRNQGPGKITDLNHDGYIDAGDVLAPMVLNAQGQDTGQGGWAYPGNTQDGDTAHPNDFIGWNFVNNTNNPFDDNGHGTNVAGLIGATGNNGAGIAGVDWQVQLMPVKFLDAGGNGSLSGAIAAINYSVLHGAKVSNNSWEGAPNDPSLGNAIANAGAHGQLFVAAAGNDAANSDVSPAYPAGFKLSNVVAVAATDNNGNLASFSNYGGNSVALAAPGVGVLTTSPGKSYGPASGTSFAAPQVSGVLALVWGERPEWSDTQVINQVLDTATPLRSLQGKVEAGLVNAAAAVRVPPRPNSPAPFHIASASSPGTSASVPQAAALSPGSVAATGPVTGASGHGLTQPGNRLGQTQPGTRTDPVSLAAGADTGDAEPSTEVPLTATPGDENATALGVPPGLGVKGPGGVELRGMALGVAGAGLAGDSPGRSSGSAGEQLPDGRQALNALLAWPEALAGMSVTFLRPRRPWLDPFTDGLPGDLGGSGG